MKILQVLSSLKPEGSHSNRLAHAIVERLQAIHQARGTNEPVVVKLRDLLHTPHPMLDADTLLAIQTPASERTAEQTTRVALDDALIAELQAADVLVLGVPMYNFGIPVQLKNWFDATARAKVTFRYTEQGAEGLLTGKKVYVALARGSIYNDPAQDSQVIWLRTMLGFLGMNDVSFFHAEGLGLGEAAVAAAHTQASAAIFAAID